MTKLIFPIVLAAFLMILQSCIVSQQPKMDFFDQAKYEHPEARFTSINVPMFLAKPIVKRALREDGGSEELIRLFKKISDIKVMTVENSNEEMTSDYGKYLTRNNFEEWITVRKEKETINFQAQQNGDYIRKLLVTIASGKELVYVDISGKFTADDISDLINYSEKNEVKQLIK